MNTQRIKHILAKVEKPGRYTGGEYGELIKDKEQMDVRMAFCFPDTYEIGMSNLGVKILMKCLNDLPWLWCERCYAPWDDMEKEMRRENIPLYALESGDNVRDFDVVAFTLQYELCYTNVVNMLELSGIPIYAKDRDDGYPIVIAGGACAYNPEPMADFIDVFSIGEGEYALVELAELYRQYKKEGKSKAEFLRAASKIKGMYVPSLYEVSYGDDGKIASFEPKFDDVPAKIEKTFLTELDEAPFPTSHEMPYIETVHDRMVLEVFRGCIRGCRFCQAGMICRPVREKSPEVLNEQAKALYKNTGYNEISMCSLSISDYTGLTELIEKLLSWTEKEKINLSLPSMRIDSFYGELMEKAMNVRQSGLTFAPEAGTQRLRDVINKNIDEEEIMAGCAAAFDRGRTALKLYFMNGLPTETDDDIRGIATLAQKIVDLYYSKKRTKGKGVQVTVSVSCLVPKPFTPFQWMGQDAVDELKRKQLLLKECITTRKIIYNYHDSEVSFLEAVFARGDRRLSKAIAEAVKRGQRFDSWDEFFSFSAWKEIFEATGIEPEFYANRSFGFDELLPWDHIDCGVSKEFLIKEAKKAVAEQTTPDCRTKCSACGMQNKGCTLCKKGGSN
ncbi:MAG: TIGR03960 family B12-binding radical SAM protein [Clostridia bacterium]|nr:TIGR03960 family B12-binding radical SAM protein [Clostridia bacterium]